MAYIEPNTDLVLCENVPLDPTYEHTWWFPSAANNGREIQYQKVNSYSRDSLRLDNYSYQRKDAGVIKVERPIADVVRCNYMAYRNASFEDKWFYAFIDKVEYVNNKTSAIYFTIDVLMTWYFDYEFDYCWIERQHARTDVPGDNLIPENLETGEYVIADTVYPEAGTGIWEHSICVIATFNRQHANAVGGMKGRIYSGLAFNYFDSVDDLNTWLLENETLQKVSEISSIVMMPNLCRYSKTMEFQVGTMNVIANATTQEEYTPRNKKLLTYPYTFCYVTNLQGNAATYPYEYFRNRSAGFRIIGAETPNPGLVLCPINYKGSGNNWDEMLSVTGYPQCAANIDSYKAWLAQNAGTITARTASLATNIVGGAIGTLLGGIGGGLSGVVSGINDAAQFMGEKYDHSIKPPQAIGGENANALFQANVLGFAAIKKNITIQMASAIDDFFDKYGYAIHRVAKPEVDVRPCWTYVKTSGCTINGSVPADDTKTIEKIHDKGITYWRHYVSFCDYSQTNSLNS